MKNFENKNTFRLLISIFTAMVTVGMCLQMFSLSYPSIMKEVGIGKVEIGILGSCLLIGMGVGGLISGILADIYGRLKVVRILLATLPVTNILVFFSESYYQLCIACFLSGMIVISVYYIGTLAVSEYVNVEIRTTILGIIQSGWSLGYIVSALMFSYLSRMIGWRSLFLFQIITTMISLIMLWRVEETRVYSNNRRLSRSSFASLSKLFCDYDTKKVFVFWGMTLFALQFGYYGFSTWLPLYLIEELGVDFSKSAFYIAGIYLAMFFGKIITGMAADRVGRKRLWVFVGLTTSFLLPVVIFIADRSNVVYLMPIFGLFYGAPYAILSTYLSESFPTSIRGVAVASVNTVGKLGSALSPVFIGMVSEKTSISAGLAFLGIAYMVSSIIPGIFIREKMYDPAKIAKI